MAGALLVLAGGTAAAQGRCMAEEPADLDPAAAQAGAAAARLQLRALADAAVERSRAVGAARW